MTDQNAAGDPAGVIADTVIEKMDLIDMVDLRRAIADLIGAELPPMQSNRMWALRESPRTFGEAVLAALDAAGFDVLDRRG